MESLLKLLPVLIRQAGDTDEAREQAAFAAWRIVTGEKLSGSCRPFRLYRRHLVVAVLDATWKKQMEMMSGELIFRLNSLFGSALVTFIEFRIDRKFVLEGGGGEAAGYEFRHTQELKAELEPAAGRIKDAELREVFLRAAAKCLERNQR